MMRLFIAIPVPADVRAALDAVRLRFAAGAPGARWVRTDQFHLTLRFLGEVAAAAVPRASAASERVASSSSPFEVEPSGLGVFPDASQPRVLWAGIGRGSEALAALAGRLEAELTAEGFPPEPRAYRPHITLARLKPSRAFAVPSDPGAGERFPAFRASELVLYRSDPGPEYTPLERRAFGRAGHSTDNIGGPSS